jgi:hypothetical protein
MQQHRIWSALTPAGDALEIVRIDQGWRVVFAGFSRSSNRSLAAALAEATGVKRDEQWIADLASTIEDEAPVGCLPEAP